MTRINKLINCHTLMNYNCLNLFLVFEELHPSTGDYYILDSNYHPVMPNAGIFAPLHALDPPYNQVIDHIIEVKEALNV